MSSADKLSNGTNIDDRGHGAEGKGKSDKDIDAKLRGKERANGMDDGGDPGSRTGTAGVLSLEFAELKTRIRVSRLAAERKESVNLFRLFFRP